MPRLDKPDYGLDAPAVVRNLVIVGCLGLLLALAMRLGALPSAVNVGGINIGLFGIAFGPGIACGFTAVAMIWSSRVGKIRRRDWLLRKLSWTGSERVVDVGCGRGLMLIGAAKHLTTGRATGIDIWRAEDLSANSREATLSNARIEGVADRIDVETADMRTLPFADASIDVVVSCAAIHNLDAAQDRATTIGEIARVLKPGGSALIDDIRHFNQYRREFAARGCDLVARLDNRIASAFWTVISLGSLRPGTLLVQKTKSGTIQ
jgi:arsenite methyltransferase